MHNYAHNFGFELIFSGNWTCLRHAIHLENREKFREIKKWRKIVHLTKLNGYCLEVSLLGCLKEVS